MSLNTKTKAKKTKTSEKLPSTGSSMVGPPFLHKIRPKLGGGGIYIYAVKLLTGPRLAILIVTNWATLIVTNWATSFSHYKNRGFR